MWASGKTTQKDWPPLATAHSPSLPATGAGDRGNNTGVPLALFNGIDKDRSVKKNGIIGLIGSPRGLTNANHYVGINSTRPELKEGSVCTEY